MAFKLGRLYFEFDRSPGRWVRCARRPAVDFDNGVVVDWSEAPGVVLVWDLFESNGPVQALSSKIFFRIAGFSSLGHSLLSSKKFLVPLALHGSHRNIGSLSQPFLSFPQLRNPLPVLFLSSSLPGFFVLEPASTSWNATLSFTACARNCLKSFQNTSWEDKKSDANRSLSVMGRTAESTCQTATLELSSIIQVRFFWRARLGNVRITLAYATELFGLTYSWRAPYRLTRQLPPSSSPLWTPQRLWPGTSATPCRSGRHSWWQPLWFQEQLQRWDIELWRNFSARLWALLWMTSCLVL